jgi:hypothetical protein
MMATRFNLNILPISRQSGRMAPKLPGLFISSPPRRSPRRRSQERLIFHLFLEGNAPLSEAAMDQLLTKLAEVYFQTDGSITSALRNVTDVLNKYLLDRNYRAASRGLKAVGYLTQIVLREDQILYAQCGPSHIYRIAGDMVENLYDPDLSGTGLGVGKSFKVRYHQIALKPNQIIVLSPQMPSSWNENLFKTLQRLKPSALGQRLLHKVEEDLEAVLLLPTPGEGEVFLAQPSWDAGLGVLDVPELDLAAEKGRTTAVEAEVEPEPPEITIKIPEEPQPAVRQGTSRPEDVKSPPPTPEFVRRQPAKKPDLARQIASEIGPVLEDVRSTPAWSAASKAGSRLVGYLQKAWQVILSLVAKMLPDDQVLDLPSWTLSLIAVLVPLIMVVFGSIFYIKRGRNQLYQEHYSRAQTLLALAGTQGESPEYYQAMVEAMDEISLARSYQQTDEVEVLFQNIRQQLDTLDRVTRLNYQPLFSRGLGADVTISRIVVTPWNDLYMLNSDRGNVIWAQSTPDGYRVVDDFSCGPIEGPITVGPLVDIVALPASQEDQATILGIDSNYTMIFCYADLSETPVIFEDTSYTLGRGPVKAITMSSSSPYNLYILDPEKRAIWIEYESQNYHEGSEYFGAVDSPEMSDAIDLATNGSELFILHAEGYLTKCVTERSDSDPICTTPFEFSDPRPGQQPGAFFTGADFQYFTIKGSPGMAVYLLDPEEGALYRFSTQLEYQEQFRPLEGIIDQPATAFAVTMSDRAFLAVDDQIYTAQLLP